MSNITTYLENKLIDASLRNVAYTSTSTYLGLYTANPTMPAGTGGVEVSGGSYARQRLDMILTAASSGATATNTTITYPTATANWGTVVGIGIFDALTLGNLLWAGPLIASETIISGDIFTISSGNLTVGVS